MDLVCLESWWLRFGGIAGWAWLSTRDAASDGHSTSKNRKKKYNRMGHGSWKTDTQEHNEHSLPCSPCPLGLVSTLWPLMRLSYPSHLSWPSRMLLGGDPQEVGKPRGKVRVSLSNFWTEIEDRWRDSEFSRMLRICFKQTSHSARSSWLHLVKPEPQRGKRRIHTT